MFLINNTGMVASRDTLATESPFAVRRVENSDGTWNLQVRCYNATGGACAAGGVYVLTHDGDEEKNPSVKACAALASVKQYVVVATAATADATWDWFVIQGYCQAKVDGDATDVSKDDYLKITTATNADAFIDNTTARTVNSFAIACEDNTSTEALKRVYLFGDPAEVA